jgi:HK97 family phage portal protein
MNMSAKKFIRGLALRAAKWSGANPRDPVIAQWFGMTDNDTGLVVNAETAMQVTAASAAVRFLAQSVAMLPLILYDRTDTGKQRNTKSNVARILTSRPNRFQTPYEFKEMMMGHALLRGNGYAEILSTGGRGVDELMPLHPDRVTPFWTDDGRRAYRYQPLSGAARIILDSEMLHLMFFSMDGLSGIDPISQHRRTLGLAIGTEKYGAKFFKNDAMPGVVLEYPGKLKDPARQNVKESWEARHQGVNRSHKVAIMEEGMKIHELSITPENAQWLESRKFSVHDIARIFLIQPHLIGALENATFSNIEQQSLEFVIYTLTPWLTKFEQAVSRDLLNDAERQTMFAEFLVDALLRGDIQSRYAAYAIGKQWGWLNTNEIRSFENMNGIGTGGDQYLVPMNMMPAETVRSITPETLSAVQTVALKRMLESLPRTDAVENIKGSENE